MKKLITILITLAFLIPAGAFGIEKLQRSGKIETDEYGGYSEAQRDHHSKRKKQVQEKTGAGYYGGEYHSTGGKCTDKEWQFVECGGKGSSKQTKKYKKVQETDKSKTKK